MITKFHSVFREYSVKVDAIKRLKEDLAIAVAEEAKIKESILHDKLLHEILVSPGIIHNEILYTKIVTGIAKKGKDVRYSLCSAPYNAPIHSFLIDKKLAGENNE